MIAKLDALCRRFDELSARLGDPGLYDDHNVFRKVAQEVAGLEPLVKTWRALERVERELADANEMASLEDDPEVRQLARAEAETLSGERAVLQAEVQRLLLPKDPNDKKNVVLEIRAGTGGEEASLFVADLFRMYSRHASEQGWKVEILSSSETDAGGLREVIALVSGKQIYSALKFESGVHRVQRVPATESQGRIHTSACTVAVLPEAEEVELQIPETELRIDTYRSSGPGGQHDNTTASAVRITHLPTGLVVTCQDEKSQHKNRAKALKVLRSRLLDRLEAESAAEVQAERRAMVGTGDRSERIRTYNFPQNRLTDHRVGLTLYTLDQVIEGALGQVIEPVRAWFEAKQLEQGGEG